MEMRIQDVEERNIKTCTGQDTARATGFHRSSVSINALLQHSIERFLICRFKSPFYLSWSVIIKCKFHLWSMMRLISDIYAIWLRFKLISQPTPLICFSAANRWRMENYCNLMQWAAKLIQSLPFSSRQTSIKFLKFFRPPASMNRPKFNIIPSAWVAKSLTGDGTAPGALVLCRWPRSEELFTAKVIHDPTPNDLAQVEVMEVPMFVEEQGENGNDTPSRKPMVRKDRSMPAFATAKVYGELMGGAGATGGTEDATFIVSQLKRFFLGEMSKVTGEMETNFDILGHRIGALEVNMKCVRERVERIENILNTAVHDFDTPTDRSTNSFLQSHVSDNNDNEAMIGIGRGKIKSETPQQTSKRSQDSGVSSVTMANKRLTITSIDQEDDDMNHDANNGQQERSKPVTVIPRAPEQRVRKDRNPRAIVVTCPRNRNMVLLGGDDKFRMSLPTYLDAKRPTSTYMVTALLRRHLPPGTLSGLCVNERQLAITNGGTMVDQKLLEGLKKQGRMQFSHTNVVDRELMLKIEDVTRDARRNIKLKEAMTLSTSKRSTGASSAPISMVAPQRLGGMGVSSSRRSKGFTSETVNDDYDGRVLCLRDAEGNNQLADGDDDNYVEYLEALPMFS